MKKINTTYKHHFHFTPKKGWINDPNGFSVYKGEKHLFYQYNPLDSKWGSMHWGHATTEDFISYEHREVALIPEEPYETPQGCYSGTGIEVKGKHVLMYTGAFVEKKKHWFLRNKKRQVQCIAIGDGVTYNKIKENPVITKNHLPDFASEIDFRDPKLLKIDHTYYAIIATKVPRENVGSLLLFKSKDLKNWEYVNELLRGTKNQGVMFECPDYFNIDGRDVLLVSATLMKSQKTKFNNRSSALFFIGKIDFEKGVFKYDCFDQLDDGFDFYAPQIIETNKNEIIMTAWMSMWGSKFVTHDLKHHWAGAMILPRKLNIVDDRLIQSPVSLSKYYGSKINSNIFEGNRYELTITIDSKNDVKCRLLHAQGYYFEMSIQADQLIINRSKAKYPNNNAILNKAKHTIREISINRFEDMNVKIIVDISSIEIFVLGRSLTSLFYGAENAKNYMNEISGEGVKTLQGHMI